LNEALSNTSSQDVKILKEGGLDLPITPEREDVEEL